MVDFIITDFSNVRGGGNIVDTVPSAEDFIVDNCTISSSSSGVFVLTPGASDVGSVSLTVSSASVTVGGTVTLTATVLDDEDEPLEDISVSFRAGSSVIGSDTTDSSGIASYTATMGSVGTFSMTAVAGGVTSTAQSVTVNKITSTISLSAVSSTISVGDSPQLTGTLSVGSGQSVKIYLGDALVDTVTTGTNGAFSFTGSATSTSGSLTFKAVYDGDSTHSSVTSSNVVITVTSAPVVTSVSLTADKSILSYADSESAVLSATVLDDSSNPMSGETVTFYKGSTSIGTATTNSSGIATKTYSATGAGDVTFTAEIDSLTDTITIVDAKWYNSGASTNGLSSQSGVSTSSDGEWVTITTSTNGEKYVLTPISVASGDNWEFACKCKTSSFNGQALGWQLANENSYALYDNRYFAISSSGGGQLYSRLGGSAQTYTVSVGDTDVIRVQRVNGYWKIYVNDTLIQNVSHSWSGNKTISFYTNKDRVQHLKELCIKSL